MMFDGGAVPAAPRWMWEAVTAVMFARLSVQLITAPLSTNVAVPVPVVVLGGTSLAATRFATKTLAAGPVLSLPQLAATRVITSPPRNPAARCTDFLRM